MQGNVAYTCIVEEIIMAKDTLIIDGAVYVRRNPLEEQKLGQKGYDSLEEQKDSQQKMPDDVLSERICRLGLGLPYTKEAEVKWQTRGKIQVPAWQKEFDEKFSIHGKWLPCDVKDFIRNKLGSLRHEIIKNLNVTSTLQDISKMLERTFKKWGVL